jgi:hypothetical protein
MSQCIYYQNLCQRPSLKDYTARHYCSGNQSDQCPAHRDITKNLLKLLSSEGNLDFLDEVVSETVEA